MAWHRKAWHLCDRGSRRHSRSLRPRNGSWRGWLIALGALCLLSALDRPAGAQMCPDNSSGSPQSTYPAQFNYDTYTQGQPFTLNTCITTTGPPWANIVTNTLSNFLKCTSPPASTTVPTPQQVALCYYSGPAGTVPCELAADGNTASCTCYVLPFGSAYTVDINAISNLDVYSDTVDGDTTAEPPIPACGLDGSSCTKSNQAGVCTSINNNTLIPGADLISAFSDSLAGTGSFPAVTDTASCSTGLYAGCMTAPCLLTDNYDMSVADGGTGLQFATCTCPTFTGPYQLPNLPSASACNAGSGMVWSASYTPTTGTPPGFVGVPGTKNCTGVTVAALATHFSGISNAAQAMGFGTVQNFKSAIQTFCGN
jgi:hypothetical protein